jgi:hypothetical protein
MEGIADRYQRIRGSRLQPEERLGANPDGQSRGTLRLMWNEPTRRETEMILRRIPRLNWEKVADLFQPEGKFAESVDPDGFALISDPDDRRFAALSAAARAPLVTNDGHVLAQSRAVGIEAVTPSGFLERAGACG